MKKQAAKPKKQNTIVEHAVAKKATAKKTATKVAGGKKEVPNKARLKIMVASTVYNNRDLLLQVCAILEGYGYEVINSEYCTLHPPLGQNNTPACLAAVAECDIFLGIINPFYSTGITHLEFKEAIRLNKPRRFVANSFVVFARKLLEQFMYSNAAKTLRNTFAIQRTSVMDDVRVIEMYNDAIQIDLPYQDRKYHWVQEFFRYDELFRHLETLFGNVDRVRQELDNLKILP